MRAIEEWRLKRPEWFVDAVINFRPNEGDAWNEIVDELLTSIEEVLSGTGVELRIGQIKEKIESLRFYFRLAPANDVLRRFIAERIEEARLKTAGICLLR